MKRFLGAMVLTTVMLGASPKAEAQVYQVYYPAPVTTSYYAPAPAPVYYAQPVTTYYRRPLLGGTVSGWRYNYAAPTYVYPSTVTYYPAW